MSRGCRPPGPLYIWQPDSREDEKPRQPCQRHLQVISGSTSQRLSRGQCGKSHIWHWISSFCSVSFICFCFFFFFFCISAGNGGHQTFHREAASSHQWWMNSQMAAHLHSTIRVLWAWPQWDSVDLRNHWFTWQENHAATHRARQDWGYYTSAQKRHDWNNAASWPGATHNPQCYSRVTLVAWL